MYQRGALQTISAAKTDGLKLCMSCVLTNAARQFSSFLLKFLPLGVFRSFLDCIKLTKQMVHFDKTVTLVLVFELFLLVVGRMIDQMPRKAVRIQAYNALHITGLNE